MGGELGDDCKKTDIFTAEIPAEVYIETGRNVKSTDILSYTV
jgi:hypothetical protein